MANQFRELDTIDFFVDKENEGGASTDPSSSAYTSADDDDVLVDRQNTMQWPNDATMRRRTRPPPMIRKPKPASRPSTASSTLNGASKGIFSATFNMYLTKPSSAAPAEAHLANAGPSLKRAEVSGRLDKVLLRSSDGDDNVEDRICRTCRFLYPTAGALRQHICMGINRRSSTMSSSSEKACFACGATDRIGYFCSRCGEPLATTPLARPLSAFEPMLNANWGSATMTSTRPASASSRVTPRTPPSAPRSRSLQRTTPSDDPRSEFAICPHCSRRFSRPAADRHIEICAKVINKPSPLRRCPGNQPAVPSKERRWR